MLPVATLILQQGKSHLVIRPICQRGRKLSRQRGTIPH